MIARLTLKPRPDFWVSWLWGQLMGTTVFAIGSESTHLRCYLHSGKSEDSKTLLLINLMPTPVEVTLEPSLLASIVNGYELTAKSLISRRVKLNGKKLRFKGGAVLLEDFPCAISRAVSRHTASAFGNANKAVLAQRSNCFDFRMYIATVEIR